MFSSEVVKMLYTGFWETIYMTLVSTALGYVIGLPLGVTLAVTGKGGIRENKVVYRILDVISNVIRSIPFLILLILIIPLTRFLVGKSYGSSATIVPLVIAAAPFIARMVESSLQEVDEGVIEAAKSMGAGYSAMAGVVGGGGLGDIAIRYGYYRYQTDIMVVTIVILVLIVQVLQALGMMLSKKLDRRNK